MQKRLNRSTICCFGCGLGWAEASTSSIVFARWRQCSHMGGHIGTTWRIRLHRPSAATMRPYVKLLCALLPHGMRRQCRLLFLSVMPSTKFGRLIECALLHTRAKIGEFCTSLLYGMPHRANLTKLRIIGCSKPIAAAVRCSLQNLELSAPSDSFDLSRKSH